MIKVRGKREQLPKLLYTLPSQSKEYVQPVCLSYQDWNRMKARINKNQILADEQAVENARKEELMRKSEEITHNFPEYNKTEEFREQRENDRHEKEEMKRAELSEEERRKQAQLRSDYLQKVRLQLLCNSQKGRILTRGFLATAGEKEREMQIELKKNQRYFDALVEEEYSKAIIENERNYLTFLKTKEAERKKALRNYYDDLTRQMELKKQKEHEEELIKKLDDQLLFEVVNLVKEDQKEMKRKEMENKRRENQYFQQLFREKALLKKYNEDMEKYEDKKILAYVESKRDWKRKHSEILKEIERLRSVRTQKVVEMMDKGKEKIIEREFLDNLRLKREQQQLEAETQKRQRIREENKRKYINDLNQQRENNKKVTKAMKERKKIEDIEERLKDVEDGRQFKEHEKQISQLAMKFFSDTKEYQRQQINEKARKLENAKLLSNMHAKHVRDALELHDAELNDFGDHLIAYANKHKWPISILNLSKFIAKWCDEDPMFIQAKRPFPKITNKLQRINEEREKQKRQI